MGRGGTDSAGKGPWSATVGSTTYSQIFTNLLQATTYYLYVQAVNANRTGRAVPVYLTTKGTSAPQSVSATTSGSSATLMWAAPSVTGSAVTGYAVGRNGYDSGGSGPWSTTTSSGTTKLTFTKLKPGSTYVLSVAAATNQGKGNTATVTVTVTMPS